MSDRPEADRLIWTCYECPVGPLTLIAGSGGIRGVGFPGGPPPPADAVGGELPELAAQLDAFFAGERRQFDVALDMRGDPLQLLIWEQLLEIPYGSTISYGELAGRIDESAYPAGVERYRRARIVGAALGRNPLAVVVPCHRVIGADGSLVGFGGGLDRKRQLLELEGVAVGRQRRPGPDNVQLGLL
jgi:methylated-DNA-[protein]-cysteine S-methyltransferase